MKHYIKLLLENLFDDVYDIQDDQDITSEITDQYLEQILPYNTKLTTAVSKILNIPKPTGFKLLKSDNEHYEKYVFTSTTYFRIPKYAAELINKLNINNWTFYDITKSLWKNNKYISRYIEKNDNDEDNILHIAISPDEDLLFIQKLLKGKTKCHYWDKKLQFILTFSGKVTDNTIVNKKENKDILKQAKQNKKHIQNFKNFIKKYNGLGHFTVYPINIDKDNYPYLIIIKNSIKDFKILYNAFVDAYFYYKKSNEHLDPETKWEIISNNNNFLRIYFYDLNNSINPNNYVILIKLTNEGKEKFNQLFNKK